MKVFDTYMLCSEADRVKIIAEIQAISSKVAQEEYHERIKNIVAEIKTKTGQDLSKLLKLRH